MPDLEEYSISSSQGRDFYQVGRDPASPLEEKLKGEVGILKIKMQKIRQSIIMQKISLFQFVYFWLELHKNLATF